MATNNSSNIVTAATGKVLQGAGVGVNCAFSTATYPATATGTGTILRADGTNWVASTPTYPNAASTAGKVVVSDGTNLVMSTPTFPNASATSGKIIKSDGTNWVASTETYADPSTSGNIMTSDGTNWTSSAPSVAFVKVSGTLTNAQIKALNATPITVVAAQGSGKIIVVVSISIKMAYGGTNVFTAGASQTINLSYGATTGVVVLSNASIVASNSRLGYQSPTFASTTYSTFDNTALVLRNPVATEITGNAANNNTMPWELVYYVVTI